MKSETLKQQLMDQILRFVSGRIVPTQLVGAGTPAPGGAGMSLVASLSREDFGATGARVAADGTIRPPA